VKKLSGPENDRLHEATKAEMRLVARRFKPEMTDEEFDEAWEEFLRLKAAKRTH
jgi:hypothetical protein